jgi:hypothetical protein
VKNEVGIAKRPAREKILAVIIREVRCICYSIGICQCMPTDSSLVHTHTRMCVCVCVCVSVCYCGVIILVQLGMEYGCGERTWHVDVI